jgi:cytoskeletal protein CcmA (bactofilin family)
MQGKINSPMTIISKGTQITGDVSSQENIRVEGYIKGTVKAGGELILTNSGKIDGEIVTSSAIIAGTISGNLTASEKTVLESQSSLTGDLRTKNLVIIEGAVFKGKCEMNKGPKN